MINKKNHWWLKYLIAFLVGIGLFMMVVIIKDLFHQTEPKDIYHILSDAFFVPGVLLIGFGLILFASNEGTFDMLSYGLLSFFNLFRRDMTKMKYHDYHDYKESKREKRQSFGHLIIIGLIFIALSILMLMLYSKN